MKNMVRVAFACLLLLPLVSNGQEVRAVEIMVGKNEMLGYIASCKSNKKLIDEVIDGKLSEAGINKGKKKKKFYTLKGISLPMISSNKIDLYYNVQQKRHRSVVHFIVSKGYDNYVTPATDAVINTSINTFLSQIDAAVAHNEEVAQKEEELQKANEKIAKEQNDVKKAEDEKARKAKELQDLQQSHN